MAIIHKVPVPVFRIHPQLECQKVGLWPHEQCAVFWQLSQTARRWPAAMSSPRMCTVRAQHEHTKTYEEGL
ncbi:hypothetical protein IG631_06541 [Alternaria alternata]|nr:hypothetical protein IG631_06541 [Alternaria alternata]